MGGLGNQMFQYAAGRRLAHVLRVILKLDITKFENEKHRTYSLKNFNIQENFASIEEIETLTIIKQSVLKRIMKRILRKPFRSAPTHIKDSLLHFYPEIPNLPEGIYLDGYWQNEKYFKDIEEIIRREFTIKDPLKWKNLEIVKLIDKTVSVGIHIRRGDYVTNQKTNQFHGTCNLDYYYQCIDKLMQIIPNPHFFVFSEEPQWVTENLKVRYPLCIIDLNGPLECHEDLRLMSESLQA